MICIRAGEPVILYRRQKDESRTRFSLFHEIAHTLFPGFGSGPLPEPGPGSPLLEREGRLERLCDAAALEAVALRMIDIDTAPACAVTVIEHERPTRWRRRQQQAANSQVAVPDFAIRYAAYSARSREQGWFLTRQLQLPKSSCLQSAARSGKPAAGHESLALLNGDLHRFRIEALPLRSTPSQGPQHRAGLRLPRITGG